VVRPHGVAVPHHQAGAGDRTSSGADRQSENSRAARSNSNRAASCITYLLRLLHFGFGEAAASYADDYPDQRLGGPSAGSCAACQWWRLKKVADEAWQISAGSAVINGDMVVPAKWELTFKVNIHAMFYLTKAAVPHMKPGGAIVNTASVN
jgi:NAD(P)-dependent dehydrogenase (short-subunit alcohol dehydrogenase family)